MKKILLLITMLIVFASSVTAFPTVLHNWSMNKSLINNTVLNDTAGSWDGIGRGIGDVNWISGDNCIEGGCVNFTSGGSGVFWIGDKDFSPDDNLSFAYWLNSPTYSAGGIYSKSWNSGRDYRANFDSNRIRFRISGTSGAVDIWCASPNLVAGEWIHVVNVLDTVNNTGYTYLNGTLCNSSSYNTWGASTDALCFGATECQQVSPWGTSDLFQGSLDRV